MRMNITTTKYRYIHRKTYGVEVKIVKYIGLKYSFEETILAGDKRNFIWVLFLLKLSNQVEFKATKKTHTHTIIVQIEFSISSGFQYKGLGTK